jgi:O-antigen/teichoic acid export membrane protein
MALGLFSISFDLVPWYLGDEFIPTTWAVMWLSPLIVIKSMVGLAGNQYFTATNQVNIMTKAYIVAIISNVIH